MSWFGRRRARAVARFENLDLELYDYQKEGGTERVKVRVFESPVGGQPPGEAETVEFPAGLRAGAKRLETRDLDTAGLTQLGEDLAAVLLPPAARTFYSRSLDHLDADVGLRIRLRLGTWALATLPWEYAYVKPQGLSAGERVTLGFLALNRRLSLVRYEILAAPKESLAPIGAGDLRLVALTAEPTGTADLDLEAETASIGQAIGNLGGLSFEPQLHATWADLQAALDHSVHIVHFAGHGSFEVEMGEDYGTFEGKGALLFETADGEADTRPAEEVALNLNQTGVRLVVLAACEGGKVDGVRAWSGIAPALARSGVPAVVAMQFRVRDDKALAFSRRFYEHLAGGGGIDSAVNAARLAMFDSKDSYGRDWGAAVLYLNAGEGEPFPQPEPTDPEAEPLTGRFAANAALGVGTFALAALYYLLHLEPKLSSLYLLGGASVPVLLSLVFLVIDKLFQTSILASVRRWLRRPGATPWLAGAAGVILLLGFATSSFYLIPNEENPAVATVEVSTDKAALASTLDKVWPIKEQAEGEIYFFKIWSPTSVTLDPGEGTGYTKKERTLFPWGSIHHRVPSGFETKPLALLLLVPETSIASKLRQRVARLQVTRNDESPVEVLPPPAGCVAIGDHKAEMESARKRYAENLGERHRTHLNDHHPAMADFHERWITAWSSICTDCSETDVTLDRQDSVLVEVLGQTGAAEELILFKERVDLDSEDQVFRIVYMKEDHG